MRILLLAPLWHATAEDAPGGVESFLAGLVAEIARHGHEQTLIAAGDSRTEAELVPALDRNLVDTMASGEAWEYLPYEQHELLLALELAHEFDVVHSHVGHGGFVLSGVPGLREGLLHTQHNDITPDLKWFVARRPHLRTVAVSSFIADALRRAGLQRCEVVPNGIRLERFLFSADGRSLAFLGRIEANKGPDIAIRVAQSMRMPLALAGPIVNRDWYDRNVRPGLSRNVTYEGVLAHDGKVEFLGGAACTLMPGRWDEPFGLVAIESMACGTPVVALARGALPDLIDHGVTGYVVDAEDELPDAIRKALELDRRRVRARAGERFALESVADSYLRLYNCMAAGATADDAG